MFRAISPRYYHGHYPKLPKSGSDGKIVGKMNSPNPAGLSPSVRAVAMPLRDELVKAGWIFGVIHWDNEREKKLAFSVKTPSGQSIYVACEESGLARKLQQFLDAR